jgi:hypothetical protein
LAVLLKKKAVKEQYALHWDKFQKAKAAKKSK